MATARLRARVPVGDCSRAIRRRSVPVPPSSVRLPKELPELSPGFYTVVSDAPADLASSASVVRVYWNIAALRRSRAGRAAHVATERARACRSG